MQLRKKKREISRRKKEIKEIRSFLDTLKLPEGLTEKIKLRFLQHARKFFLRGGKLWQQEQKGRHQQVVEEEGMSYQLLKESHDQLGHKEFYATRCTLGDHFWWPTINMDVQWIVSTCHQCQILSFKQVVLPPIVQTLALLFCKAYIDMLHIPPSYGYKYIVQARDSLTNWPEWRTLTRETGRTLGQFLFEEILCH